MEQHRARTSFNTALDKWHGVAFNTQAISASFVTVATYLEIVSLHLFILNVSTNNYTFVNKNFGTIQSYNF